MPRERLHRILQDLRTELSATEALTGEDKALLTSVVDQIRETVEDPDRAAGENGSLLTSLDDAALHFEAEHPRLTKTLFQISELLRSAGLS